MTLRLTDEEDEMLTATAVATGRSKQDIAREAIREFAARRGHAAMRDNLLDDIMSHDRSLLARLAE